MIELNVVVESLRLATNIFHHNSAWNSCNQTCRLESYISGFLESKLSVELK